MKTLKFVHELVDPILKGEKFITWRLWDEKDLSEGDEIGLIDKSTGESFSKAKITKVTLKKMGGLAEEDFGGHEEFKSEEERYKVYSRYYGRPVTPNDIVKIIKFELRA